MIELNLHCVVKHKQPKCTPNGINDFWPNPQLKIRAVHTLTTPGEIGLEWFLNTIYFSYKS